MTDNEPLKKKSVNCYAIVIALLAGGIGACCLYDWIQKKYLNRSAELTIERERVSKLAAKVECLQNEISQLKQKLDQQVTGCKFDGSRMRAKWNAWVALKNKIEAKEPFETELNHFYNTFADQPHVKSLVTTLLDNKKGNTVINLLPEGIRKYVNDRVTLNKMSTSKVTDVSFYILLSFFSELGE